MKRTRVFSVGGRICAGLLTGALVSMLGLAIISVLITTGSFEEGINVLYATLVWGIGMCAGLWVGINTGESKKGIVAVSVGATLLLLLVALKLLAFPGRFAHFGLVFLVSIVLTLGSLLLSTKKNKRKHLGKRKRNW